jgi:hypothetical protein
LPSLHIVQQVLIVTLMRFCHDEHGLVRIKDPAEPGPRFIKQRPASDYGAELLGPLIARDLPGKREQPLAVSAGEYDSPAMPSIGGPLESSYRTWLQFHDDLPVVAGSFGFLPPVSRGSVA